MGVLDFGTEFDRVVLQKLQQESGAFLHLDAQIKPTFVYYAWKIMTSVSCPAKRTLSCFCGEIIQSLCALGPSFARILCSKHALSQLASAQSSDLISDAFLEVNGRLTLRALNDLNAPVRPLVFVMHNLIDSQTIQRLEMERSKDIDAESMFCDNRLADSGPVPKSEMLLLLCCNLILLKLANLAETAKKLPEGILFRPAAVWGALDMLWRSLDQVVTSTQVDHISKAELQERQDLCVLLVQLCAPFLQQYVKQTHIRADSCCKLLHTLLITKGPSRKVAATAVFKAGKHFPLISRTSMSDQSKIFL